MSSKDSATDHNLISPVIYSFDDLKSSSVSRRIDDSEIRIISRKENPAYFTAGLCGPYLDTVRFSVRTINERGARDPFFQRYRAADLAASAIAHFEQYQPVSRIAFNWSVPELGRRSDNYTAYINKRDELKEELDYHEAQTVAAFATWTLQKIAVPNGFNDLERIDECGDPTQPVRVLGFVARKVAG